MNTSLRYRAAVLALLLSVSSVVFSSDNPTDQDNLHAEQSDLPTWLLDAGEKAKCYVNQSNNANSASVNMAHDYIDPAVWILNGNGTSFGNPNKDIVAVLYQALDLAHEDANSEAVNQIGFAIQCVTANCGKKEVSPEPNPCQF